MVDDVVEPVVEVVAEPVAEVVAESEPEPITADVDQPAPVIEVVTEPEVKPTAEAVAQSESEPVVEIVIEPEPVADIVAERAAEVVAESEPVAEVVVEPEPVAEVTAKPEPTAEVVVEQAPEPTKKVESVATPELQSVSETVIDPIAEPAPTISEPEPTVSEVDESESERIKVVSSPSSLSSKLKAAFRRGKSSEKIEVEEMPEPIAPLSPVSDKQHSQSHIEPATPLPIEIKKAPYKAPEIEIQPEAIEPKPVEQVEAVKPADSAISESDFEPIKKPTFDEPAVMVSPKPEPVAPQQAKPAPQQKASIDDQKDGVLVNWTFTPPPDITPEELRASGQKAPEGVAPAKPAAIKDSAEPLVAKADKPATTEAKKTPQTPSVSEFSQIDPELATPSSRKPNQPVNKDTGSNSMTVEIGISKALKEVTIGDPRVPDKKYNKVASAEYTEVSKAFAAGNSPDTLHEELIHLAAVCLAWADAIEKRKLPKSGKKAA